MPKMKLGRQYTENMSLPELGHALYHPVSSSALKIGDVGYFNDLGAWQYLCNVTDAKSLSEYNLMPIEGKLRKAPPDENIEWGPMLAEHTKGTEAGLAAKAS
jgi:hypothetical protein